MADESPVEPLAIFSFSTSRTSRSVSVVRKYAALVPMMPPPTTTTSARSGRVTKLIPEGGRTERKKFCHRADGWWNGRPASIGERRAEVVEQVRYVFDADRYADERVGDVAGCVRPAHLVVCHERRYLDQ